MGELLTTKEAAQRFGFKSYKAFKRKRDAGLIPIDPVPWDEHKFRAADVERALHGDDAASEVDRKIMGRINGNEPPANPLL